MEKDSVAENTPRCVLHVSTCIEKKDREVDPVVEENMCQSLQIISENTNCCLCEIDGDAKESVKPPNELLPSLSSMNDQTVFNRSLFGAPFTDANSKLSSRISH